MGLRSQGSWLWSLLGHGIAGVEALPPVVEDVVAFQCFPGAKGMALILHQPASGCSSPGRGRMWGEGTLYLMGPPKEADG